MNAELSEVIRRRYREPHRRYHDERHLDSVLLHVDELSEHASDPDLVRLAALFHDAVYEPTRTDNEEISAQLAEGLLPAFQVTVAHVAEVARLVRITASHQAPSNDTNGAVLCDADLAVLAGSADDYSDYAAGVRVEYAHLDETAFAAGRANVLQGIIARPRIFITSTAFDAWESAARRNISTELMLLASITQSSSRRM